MSRYNLHVWKFNCWILTWTGYPISCGRLPYLMREVGSLVYIIRHKLHISMHILWFVLLYTPFFFNYRLTITTALLIIVIFYESTTFVIEARLRVVYISAAWVRPLNCLYNTLPHPPTQHMSQYAFAHLMLHHESGGAHFKFTSNQVVWL